MPLHIEDEDGNIVCIGYEEGDKNCFKDWGINSRRIVAALNYCAGVPTSELEANGATAGFWGRACSRLKGKNDKLEAENAALRAAVAEMQLMLPVIEKIESGHTTAWAWATSGTGIATANAYRQTLETALAQNEKNK